MLRWLMAGLATTLVATGDVAQNQTPDTAAEDASDDLATTVRTAQTTEMALALGQYIALVPAVLLVIASIALLLMPLTRGLHARIVDELSR